MEFLKELLGEELYSQLESKINEHNGNEANKDKQIKLGNLATGEYVGKGKYDALQETLKGKDVEITNANSLIADLKKASKGNDGLQDKITAYEAENTKLQEQIKETKIKAAIKVALLSEKAVDVDYLTYKLNEKLKEKGEALELDENENIKDWKGRVEDLKVQFPNMFDAGSKKIIEPNKLPEGEKRTESISKSDLLKMPYAERNKFFNDNPEAYEAAMKAN